MSIQIVDFKAKKKSGEGVLEGLTMLVESAKEGNIVNFFGVALLQDNEILSGWANDNKPFVMAGGIESAKHDFLLSTIERS